MQKQFGAIARRCSTCAGGKKRKPFVVPSVKRTAIVSTSRDVFRNLALEHWLYKNRDFATNHMLMLWVNEPCVVVGRHQNPWTECNVPWLRANDAPLARRNSGGGAVYHDGGNLNLTFFTPSEHYHRRTNLQFVSDAVYKDHGLRMDINQREDLAVRDHKVSGTAAKLARHCAYHHCTLLIASDKQRLRAALLPSDWHIVTNATKSVKSKILNLSEECPAINVNDLTLSLARRYLEWNNVNLYQANRGSDHLSSLETEHVATISEDSLKAQFVTPSEEFFPGLDEIHDEYRSWQWTFGKTPRFTASKMFKTSTRKHSGRGDRAKVFYTSGRTYAFELKIHVEAGVIQDVDVNVPCGYHDGNIMRLLQDAQAVVGERYDLGLVERVERVFKDASDVEQEHDSAVVN